MIRRAFWLLVAGAIGFWIDEATHLIYQHTLHAPRKRPQLADVVTITEGRFHR